MNQRHLLALSLACLTTFAISAHGGTLYWDGNANTINAASDNTSITDMNWLNGGNWDNGSASAPLTSWTAGEIAIFVGTFAGTQKVTLGSGITLGGLVIGGAGSAYTISLTGTGFNQLGVPSGAITINAGSTLSADAASNNAHNIAGGAGLTLNGGTLTSINGPAGPANDGGFGNWLLRGPVTVGGASASTISSSTLYLGGGGGAFTVADATGSTATDLLVSAKIIVGSLALTKAGAGTMELTAVNTFTNPVTVNGGLLKLASTGSLATTGVAANSGGRFRMVDAAAVAGTLTANAGGSIEVENSAAQTWTKAISGAGTFVKGGAGTLTVGTGVLAVSGGMTVEAGVLDISRSGGSAFPMPLNVMAGATFKFTSSVYNNFVLPGGIITPATPGITVENGATLESAGTAQNANNISGFTLKGGSVINTGTPDPTYATFITRYITVQDNPSTINVPKLGFSSSALPLDVADTPGAIDLSVVGPVVNGDGSGGAGGFVKTGAGKVSFQSTVTMNNPIAINAGTAAFGGLTTTTGAALSISNATLENTAQINAGTITFTNATGNIGGHLVGAGKISILGGSNVTATSFGLYTSAGGYEVTGSTLILNNTTAGARLSGGQTMTIGNGGVVRTQGNQYNTIQGTNFVIENGGLLSLDNTSSNANGAGSVTLKGGTVAQGGNPDTGYAHLIVNGGLTVQDNPSTWSAELGFTGNQTVNVGETGADVDFNVTGRLRGNGPGGHGFTKTGIGKMRVSGLGADYGGPLVISAGVLEAYKAGDNIQSPLSTQPVTIQNGGTLSLLTVGGYNALGASGAYPSTINVEAGGTLIASSLTKNAHNIGSLVLSGGTVSALNANHDTFSNFVINGSISHTGNTASVIAAAAISFRSPGGTVDVADGTAENDLTISSEIMNHGGVSVLTKTGNGKLRLTGASTYSGATTITSGSVELAGVDSLRYTSSVSISGGTLLLSGSGNQINDSAGMTTTTNSISMPALTLSGTVTESLGTLTLGSAGTSVFDLGSGTAMLTFADSHLTTPWTGMLMIWNWSGSLGGGGTDQLNFTNATGLTPAQISSISFLDPAGLPSGTYGAQLLGSGELVPVPEPTSLVTGAILLAFIGVRKRRPNRIIAG